ncbi:MAG: B12-binding domain-containing radical SAM protein [Planctomycetes bacterium]|nr:B12-binding domain-containing radical SAM protein [Planctomycetota bacterium]
MKLLLVQPSHFDRRGKIFKSHKLPYPGLALPLIAALTPPDWDIEIVNDYAEEIDFDTSCDLVGITAMTPQAPRAYQIADRFRARGRRVVMGGFHATNVPEQTLDHVDAIVRREAENVWGDIIDDVKRGKLQKIYCSDEPADLSKLPVPRYDLLDRKHYSLRAFPVQATRGCPNQCDFCSVTEFYGGKYRFRPVDDVVRDVKATGRRFTFFIDDNIAASAKYCIKLCSALKPLNIIWGSQCSLTVGNSPEVLEAASDAGCFSLFVGMESLNPESLSAVNKEFNKVGEYERQIRAIRDAGIMPMVSMIAGLDGDDERVFDQIRNFLTRMKIPIAYAFILTPGPATRLFERFKKEGRMLSYDWSNYGGDKTIFQPMKMSPEVLDAGLWEFFRPFYSLPSIFRRLFVREAFTNRRARLRTLIALKFNLLHRNSLMRGVHPLRG